MGPAEVMDEVKHLFDGQKPNVGCDHCKATRIGAQLFHEPTCSVLASITEKKSNVEKIERPKEWPDPPPIDLIEEGSGKVTHPKEEEPVTPEGYGELKVGMEGILNGVPVRIRKITRKDIIMRPLNRSIRDKGGLMVSFKEGKK